MMVWIVPLFLLIAVVAYVPFWVERRRPAVGQQQRNGSDYEFAQLSKGVTAYKWHGPVRGPVIVAVHGLTTPSAIWDDLIPELAGIGYRVLSYDLYGRGLSDAVEGRQNAAFFQRQLDDLLRHEGLGEDVTLLGYSMGGSIVTGYAATSTHKISKLILVASAGVGLNETSAERLCRLVPGIGDWLAHILLPRQLRIGFDTSTTAHPIETVKAAQLDRGGFIPSVVSSRRYQLADVQRPEHRIIGRTDIPVYAIWGQDDQIIPITSLGQLAQWNRAARQEVIEGAGHDLLQTHTGEVGTVLRKMLTR